MRRSAGDSSRSACRHHAPVVIALVASSIGPIIVLVVRARINHGTWTGAFAPFGGDDQLRYLAWIRDAGAHGLIANPFGGDPSGHVYLNPLFLFSGIATRIGASSQLAYVLWLPVAVGALYGGYAAYVRRLVPPGRMATAALVLALFYVTP